MPRAKPSGAVKRRKPDVPDAVWHYFADEPQEVWEEADGALSVIGIIYHSEVSAMDAWLEVRGELLRRWIRERPGTRPGMWWRVEAPRQEGDRSKPQPRRRIGGTGEPWPGSSLEFAVPVTWTIRNARNAEGEIVGHRPTTDPDDPPAFESQAAYLDRHGHLTDAEREKLAPDAFEPVPLDETDRR